MAALPCKVNVPKMVPISTKGCQVVLEKIQDGINYRNITSTTQKHISFVSEPMGDKGVNELAGIGKALCKRLEAKGFDKAYVVLGQFLVLKKHKELFVQWMQDLIGANRQRSSECYQCLSDWSNEFM